MYTILLVDDEALAKISLQNMIQSDPDFTVAGSAANGQEALDFFAEHPVDAVIADLQMPIMDGVTLITRLRAAHFHGPILALSNYSDFELVRGAMKAGAFDYLLKADINPELIAEYLSKIKSLLLEHTALEQQQSHDEMLRARQQRDLFRFAFQQYLANPNAHIQKELILQGIPDGIFPAVFLDITMPVDRLGTTPAAQFVESVLMETLSDVSPVFPVHLSESELVVLVSEASIRQQRLVLSVRLERLYRTVHAYSSQTPLIFYAQDIDSVESVRECHQLCTQAKKAGLSNKKPITCISFSDAAKNTIRNSDVKVEILQTLRYVNENYMNKISLDDISSYVHLNKEYLCRLFKKETGKNLFQYITDVRMQAAANMLTTTNMPVSTISRRTGFSSPYVFSKKFKEYYGVSPADYAPQSNSPGKPARD